MNDQLLFLVDDDFFCLSIYEQYLIEIGFSNVILFEKGFDCIANLHQHPSIVFIDYNLDDISGLDLLSEIKKFNPLIHVVMVSGDENPAIAKNAIHLGAFDFIVKGTNEKEAFESILKRLNF